MFSVSRESQDVVALHSANPERYELATLSIDLRDASIGRPARGVEEMSMKVAILYNPSEY